MSDVVDGLNFNLKSFYKGRFLKYVDDNYIQNENFEAYIEIKDLLLNNSGTDIAFEQINDYRIINRKELNFDENVKSIGSIICKPLFVNQWFIYLEPNDTVFVFLIDGDPKKIFYVPITNDKPKQDRITLRRGNNIIYLDKDEIKLVREKGKDTLNDISFTLSKFGIEFVTDTFMVNGENYIDLFKRKD